MMVHGVFGCSAGLLSVLALSACGSGDATTESKSSTERQAGAPDCDVRGINAKERKTGTCEDDGTTVTVVNRDDTLKLDELDARLKGDPEVLKVAASDGYRERALGLYIVLGLSITNRTKEPQTLAGLHINLLDAGGNRYSQDVEATLAVPGDLYKESGKGLQPGLTTSGRIAFDVPPKVARSVAKRGVGGNLIIEPFSQTLGRPETTFGYIRLYQ